MRLTGASSHSKQTSINIFHHHLEGVRGEGEREERGAGQRGKERARERERKRERDRERMNE